MCTSPSESVVVRAPGKLVLMGEYAVLDGAPAIALAIDRGVICRRRPASRMLVRTPGDDRFVGAALEAVGAPVADYMFSAWNPLPLPEKPGFGSSAASCVAAVLAGGGHGHEAFQVHRRVQGGGSGVDVAACLHGGMIRFSGGRVEELEPVLPVVVYSGRAASTVSRVARYLAWGGGRVPFTEEMRGLVDGFVEEPIRSMMDARRLLNGMARSAGIDYETGALAEIAALAEGLGGAAKPSGAGGGDCAVALFADGDAVRVFQENCREMGLAVISYAVAPGATVFRERVQEDSGREDHG